MVSATASCTSRPSSFATLSATASCRSSPNRSRCRRRGRSSLPRCSPTSTSRSESSRAPTSQRWSQTHCAPSAGERRPRGPLDVDAVDRVREYLAVHAAEPTPASTLEEIAGADRFTIARQFRRAFGTSPDRYRTLRRLGLARRAIESGEPLARAAAEAGFSDQSHMTRQFKRAYGLTPAFWSKAVRASVSPAPPRPPA